MNYSKLLLSALGIFCFSLTYGQSKTNSSLENSSTLSTLAYSNVSQNLNNSTPHSIFVTAENLNFSNTVIKQFQVKALRSGYVKIKDVNSTVVATVFVEQGFTDIQFLCFNGDYILFTSEVDMKDPKYTN